ncbi:MAG: HAD family hydrolase [Roseiflexaceae bacterium]
MIEIIRAPTAKFTLAAIDFDGTMSLIRIGWQQVMHSVMKAALRDYHPNHAHIDTDIRTYIAHSTGQPSIIQMAWVDEQVMLYGGPQRGAHYYLDQFSNAMKSQIDDRVASITDESTADAFMIPGARQFLQTLAQRNIHIALVSGTEHHHLVRESAALKIDSYFDAGIYGPGSHAPGFTKHDAIAQLIARYNVAPNALLSVGDGPVEIKAGRVLGGYSLAVASDEHSGGLDADKRQHLLDAGADAVVAHFSQLDVITQALLSH